MSQSTLNSIMPAHVDAGDTTLSGPVFYAAGAVDWARPPHCPAESRERRA